MEVNEIHLTSNRDYTNPYLEVDAWVTLTGPGEESYLIPVFWDGGKVFRVRLVATSPGKWTWASEREIPVWMEKAGPSLPANRPRQRRSQIRTGGGLFVRIREGTHWSMPTELRSSLPLIPYGQL